MTPGEIAEVRIALAELATEMREARSDITEIKGHTSQTNGRVRRLEVWQARVIGALAVLVFLVSAVGIPIVVALL